MYEGAAEVLRRVFDPLDVRDRVTVNQQQVGERAFLDHAQLARVRVVWAIQR